MSDFVPLHVHGQRSELDGLTKTEQLISAAIADGQPAVSITDHGDCGAHWSINDAALKAGLTPILGLEAYLSIGPRTEKNVVRVPAEEDFDGGGESDGATKEKRYEHLTLLAANSSGWRNLISGHNASWDTANFFYKPRWDYDLLAKHAAGLIAGTGCLGGPVAGPLIRDDVEVARANLAQLRDIFGRENLFVEVMDHGIRAERKVIPGLVALAKEFGLPVVATNDSHYAGACDAPAHDAWLAIGSSKGHKTVMVSDDNRFRFNGEGYHLRTAAEMHALFDTQPGTENAVANTLLIASQVEENVIPASGFRLPHVKIPDGTTEADWLYDLVKTGLLERYGSPLPLAVKAQARLEVDTYVNAGFAGYLLAVRDLVNEARRRGIRVGPGRGSGPGSICAYALKITNIEPLSNGLLFERFLNPDRPSMPDFDIDFQSDRRDEMFVYAAETYGADFVARIGAPGVSWAKKAIRDIGRVTGRDELADTIARLVPSLGPAERSRFEVLLEPHEPMGAPIRDLIASDPEVAALVEDAKAIEGVASSAGIHACGFVIGNEPLTSLVPMRQQVKNPGAPAVTEWDWRDIEKFGLVKFDFLAIDDLTVVQRAVEMIEELTGEIVDPDNATCDPADPRAARTYAMLAAGNTSGVFQLASTGMTELCKQVRPTSLADLSALVALYRPGPMGAGMHHEYANRKNGAAVDYGIFTPVKAEQDAIATVLDDTCGVVVYQEQLQQLAEVVADFTKDQKFKLQKAFSKKLKPEMDALYQVFLEGGQRSLRADGAAKVSFRVATLNELWRTFEASASYLFNRSHSAAYGQLAYMTAWLKANWPAPYGAALLSVVPTDKSKAVKRQGTIAALRAEGVEVFPPDVNDGGISTAAYPDGTVRLGLSEVKGVSGNAQWIVLEREKNGPFTSLADLMSRVTIPRGDGMAKLPVSAVIALIEAGAMDSFGPRMGQVMAVRAANQCVDVVIPDAEWGVLERSERQRRLLGVVLGPPPTALLADQLETWQDPSALHRPGPIGAFTPRAGVNVSVVGQVLSVNSRDSIRGRFGRLVVEDATGRIEGIAWNNVWQRLEETGSIPVPGQIIGLTGVTQAPWGADADGEVFPELRLTNVWTGDLRDNPRRPTPVGVLGLLPREVAIPQPRELPAAASIRPETTQPLPAVLLEAVPEPTPEQVLEAAQAPEPMPVPDAVPVRPVEDADLQESSGPTVLEVSIRSGMDLWTQLAAVRRTLKGQYPGIPAKLTLADGESSQVFAHRDGGPDLVLVGRHDAGNPVPAIKSGLAA